MRGFAEYLNKNYSNAINYLLQSYDILLNIKIYDDIPEILYKISESYLNLKKKEKAKQYFDLVFYNLFSAKIF